MLSLLLIFFAVSLFPGQTLAAGDFILNQTITYTLKNTGQATASHQIELTNNYSQIYAQNFQFELSGQNIKNITGHDQVGNIIDSFKSDSEKTTIVVKFNHPAVGKNQVTKFQINYQIENMATQKGNTWEVVVPKHPQDDQTSLTTKLLIPNSFGQLSFSSLKNLNVQPLSNFQQITIANSDKNKKILLIFGNHQLFDFNLKYHLQNSKNLTVTTKIAIPPDTQNQQIVYSKIDPKPQDISVDPDGNWLASYKLKPNAPINIEVAGTVKIHSLDPNFKTTSPNYTVLTQENSQFWPTSNPSINQIATTLSDSRSIYNYVTSTLQYDYSKVNNPKRQGALYAINNPGQSVCTEFTDLFVTLARLKGIPAREVEGFAYSNNPKVKPLNQQADVLHAWPQYYDQNRQQWISIDPTWAQTTSGIDYFNDLDFNHFTFVIHGVDAQYPPPPGAYKTDPSQKTVEVVFSSSSFNPTYQPPSFKLYPGYSHNTLSFSQPNKNSLHLISLSIPQINYSKTVDTLPPYSTQSLNLPKLSLIRAILPQNRFITLIATYQNSPETITLKLKNPDHFLALSLAIGLSITILSLGGIIIIVSLKHQK